MLYHEAVRFEVSTLTKGGRLMPSGGLDDVDKAAREAFLAAATAAIELGADAREYVVAQFARWREASAFHRKFLLPAPHHMGTLAARVRYLQHKTTVEVRRSRVVTLGDDEQDDHRRFYVEERQLKGLARVRRVDPADVLADQPERFSREFLIRKGVFHVVQDLWYERTRA